MFLSFIVPVYNTETYLAECLDSLLDQNIPAADYEIICVNDGSTDGSAQILDGYHEKHINIKIIPTENNGVSNARNIGIDAAAGDYIWMVDSDDFIARQILADLRCESYGNDSDIIDFGAYTFNEELTESELSAYFRNELRPVSFANHVYITRSLFRREFIRKNKLRFDPNIAYSEDSLFKCECLLCKPVIKRLNRAYYFVRFRKGSTISLSTKTANEKKLSSWCTVAVKFKRYYFDTKADTSGMKAILADLMMANLWAALSLLSQMPVREAKPHLKRLKESQLFPSVRPKDCTIRRSYQTSRKDLIGKIYDKLYINTHTVWGYHLMRLWNALYSLLKHH